MNSNMSKPENSSNNECRSGSYISAFVGGPRLLEPPLELIEDAQSTAPRAVVAAERRTNKNERSRCIAKYGKSSSDNGSDNGEKRRITTRVRDVEASAITVMDAGAGRSYQHAQKQAWVSGAALETHRGRPSYDKPTNNHTFFLPNE